MDVVTIPNRPCSQQAPTGLAFAYPINRLPAGMHTDQLFFRQDFLSGRRRNLLFYRPRPPFDEGESDEILGTIAFLTGTSFGL